MKVSTGRFSSRGEDLGSKAKISITIGRRSGTMRQARLQRCTVLSSGFTKMSEHRTRCVTSCDKTRYARHKCSWQVPALSAKKFKKFDYVEYYPAALDQCR